MVTGKWTGSVPTVPTRSSPELAVSDHRILSTSIQVPCPRPQRGVLPKAPVFQCPDNFSADSWRENLERCWDVISSRFQLDCVVEDPRLGVQDKWDTFLLVVKHTFLMADSSPKNRDSQFKHKGVVSSVRQENLPASGRFCCMKERKIRKSLARWYELGRLRTRHFTEELSEAHKSLVVTPSKLKFLNSLIF